MDQRAAAPMMLTIRPPSRRAYRRSFSMPRERWEHHVPQAWHKDCGRCIAAHPTLRTFRRIARGQALTWARFPYGCRRRGWRSDRACCPRAATALSDQPTPRVSRALLTWPLTGGHVNGKALVDTAERVRFRPVEAQCSGPTVPWRRVRLAKGTCGCPHLHGAYAWPLGRALALTAGISFLINHLKNATRPGWRPSVRGNSGRLCGNFLAAPSPRFQRQSCWASVKSCPMTDEPQYSFASRCGFAEAYLGAAAAHARP
jgi:hypothetical protein